MSNIAFLQNVASSTRLPEGSIQDLMKRVTKVEAGLSDVEKAKIDTAIADAFTSVSAVLDKIELDQAQSVVNRLQANQDGPRHAFRAPAGDDDRTTKVNNAAVSDIERRGWKLPKAAD